MVVPLEAMDTVCQINASSCRDNKQSKSLRLNKRVR